jgi:hypothetical protein
MTDFRLAWRVGLLALLLLAYAVPSRGTADEAAAPAVDPVAALEPASSYKSLRAQIPVFSRESFEAERLKGTAEIDALVEELRACYRKDDVEGLDRIVQRYRDKPYTLVWGKSALKHVYYWLGLLAPDETGEDHEKWLNSWVDARPKSATPRILLAHRYIKWAWDARGSGFAGEVTDEGWKLFRERLERAEALLSQAEKLEHPDAELYATRIQVAQGLGADRDEVDAAIALGIKLDPTYHPLFESAATYLLPRWHGAQGDVEAFADGLKEQLGEDLGSEMYMRVALEVLPYERSRFFSNTSFDYEKILAGWLSFGAKYRSHLNYQNEMAYLATVQRDRAVIFRLMSALDDEQLAESTWGSIDTAKAWRRWSEWKVDPGEAIQVFPADRAPLRAVAFSPDGARLATFGMRSVDPALIWDVKSARLQSRLPSTREPIHAYAVSADRTFALAGGGNVNELSPKLILWNLGDNSVFPRATPAPTSVINGIAFSHRGDRFGSVRLRDYDLGSRGSGGRGRVDRHVR